MDGVFSEDTRRGWEERESTATPATYTYSAFTLSDESTGGDGFDIGPCAAVRSRSPTRATLSVGNFAPSTGCEGFSARGSSTYLIDHLGTSRALSSVGAP